ncbi:MAG: DEAD/DEAH box helicase family protein [Anaerolineales bacterium]|nr:DEAD/DEAH box helicase family protein [Anaerolineales bacterium]
MRNPIINSPYKEPMRHFKADERGISDEVMESRRPSARYVSAMPRTRKRDRQLSMNLAEGAFSAEMQEDNEFVNKVRFVIGEWRKRNYPGITKTSRDLLFYWQDESRENKLFFCQIEALETLIYINEVAEKAGEIWLLNDLRKANEEANPGLSRLAFKMATGSGKTVVMAMMIAYHTLNKVRYPQDTRFTDAFAIITPGITIRDRLNVLHPNDPQNYYIKRDIVSYQDFELLQGAVVLVMNYHQMGLRDNQRFQMGGTLKATELIKQEVQKESPNAMVNRAFKSLLNKPRVLVINDEAHHCYREKPTDEKLSGDERKEADENNEAARVWISGLEALTKKINVNAILDLSATPYFLRGSGYEEGTLFPWTVSDFSLLDALECGVVKIPRLPVESNTIKQTEMPEFRNLWAHISDDPHMPKKGLKRGTKEEGYNLDTIILPTKLQEALEALYGSYETYYKDYVDYKKKNPAVMPPVMIVVCNNTTVSKMVYRWIAGYEIETQTRYGVEKGNLPIFRNEDGVNMLEKPNTLIVDSAQLESGEQIDADFKKSFAKEIEDFRKEYRKRFQGRDEPSDEELLREVMNTVGKPGKLGENIKCVVSVSMLTEGWDVNTVTHILGVRAFTTQLLCEQVVGRALRRVDYNAEVDPEDGVEKFSAEYAEVYGVPFNFLKAEGPGPKQPPKFVHRVQALEGREKYEIAFPRLEGYRYELDEQKLGATFTEESKTSIENEPTKTVSEGAIGEEVTLDMGRIKDMREGEVSAKLAEVLLKRYYRDGDGASKYWLYPQIKRIVDEYIDTQVRLKDNMVIGYLLVGKYLSGSLTKIQQAIVKHNIERQEQTGEKHILPILTPFDSLGSTRYVDFLTTKAVSETVKSHVNYVVADTAEWEQGVAKRLEEMPEVLAYVKNHNLGFSIPYEHQGISRQYIPDFIVVLELPHPNPLPKGEGTDSLLPVGEGLGMRARLNLLIEVTGKKDDKKGLKVKTTREMWIPAVNNTGRYGMWALLEIQDIHETMNLIRAGLERGFENLTPGTLFDDKSDSPL